MSELKIDTAGAGRFGGHVAVFGNVDQGGDVIAPGATAASLPDLVKTGFLAYAHDYHAFPVGMIDEAREDKVGLWISGPFHSTPTAQEARTVAAERLSAGKTMGMSIGYDAEEWTYRAAKEAESAPGGQVRVLTRIRILEGSLALLPMNERAGLSEVKSLGDLPSLGDLAAAAAEVKEGRTLSATSRARIRAWLESLAGLDAARADLEAWLAATEPPPKEPKTASARQRFAMARLLARLDLEGLRA